MYQTSRLHIGECTVQDSTESIKNWVRYNTSKMRCIWAWKWCGKGCMQKTIITDDSSFVAVRTSMLPTFVMGHGRGRAMKKQLQKVNPVYSYNMYNLGIFKCASPKANQSSCQMPSWCIVVLKSPDLPTAQVHPQLWPCLKTLSPTWTTLWFHLLTLNNFPSPDWNLYNSRQYANCDRWVKTVLIVLFYLLTEEIYLSESLGASDIAESASIVTTSEEHQEYLVSASDVPEGVDATVSIWFLMLMSLLICPVYR